MINLSNESANRLFEKYSLEQLKVFQSKLIQLDKKGSLIYNLNNISQTKEKINSLKNIIDKAMNIYEFKNTHQEGGLMVVPKNKLMISIAEHIIVKKQELRTIEKEVDLGTSINTDKQFFYNFRQNNMEVTNELSFEIDMMFEPLATIPLRLQYNTNQLNKEISFEVNFF